MVACGGNNGTTTVTTPNGNTINNPPVSSRTAPTSAISIRAIFRSSTAPTTQPRSTTQPTRTPTPPIRSSTCAVNIAVGISATFLARSPDGTMTAVYDPSDFGIGLVTNSTQITTATVGLPDWAAWKCSLPDSKTLYVPTGNHANAIQVIDVTNSVITTTIYRDLRCVGWPLDHTSGHTCWRSPTTPIPCG